MNRTSIELKHKDYIKKYDTKKNDAENIKNKILDLQMTIKESKTLNEQLSIEHNISKLNKEYTEIMENENEINYLLKVVPILNLYNSTNDNQINNDEKEYNFETHSIANKSTGKEKGSLYKSYMNIVENCPIAEKPEKIDVYNCNVCNHQKLISQSESVLICPICGTSDQYFDMGINTLSYEQEINSEGNISFTYKRINHFNEWIAQFQAKESTDIPQPLLDELMNEFCKMKIKDTTLISSSQVKQILKKLKYNKYYEHVPHITNLLTGINPPNIPPLLEEKLRNMFRDIQIPFEKNKPSGRYNFLSYSYCLYKFCELLGYDDLLCNFPLLKSREKLHMQDVIWKKICVDLNWEYISTV